MIMKTDNLLQLASSEFNIIVTWSTWLDDEITMILASIQQLVNMCSKGLKKVFTIPPSSFLVWSGFMLNTHTACFSLTESTAYHYAAVENLDC